MPILKCIFTLAALGYFCRPMLAQSDPSVYNNPDLPVDIRVDDLLSRMTVEEKIGQLMNRAEAIPRLNVPEYDWWSESLHGVARAGIATVFPQAIGLGATWDTELMLRLADVISTEARAKHHEFVRQGQRRQNQGLTMWSPNVNIFRDPRWGRGQETYGEDPYLTGRLGVAFVKGLQGDHPEYFKVIATPKHYTVHSGPEPERHEFDAITSPRAMYDTYFPAFEACVREAGAFSIMCAYNRTLGKACCASPPLMQKVLRESWGFQGYVVSDCDAVDDIEANHHLVETKSEAAALALKSGTDLNCGFMYQSLSEACEKGLIIEADLDIALRRLLTARFRLGMFDPPEKVPYAAIPIEKNDCPEHQKLALEAAQKSIVLLKNENQTLPLKNGLKKIAVIGPNADRISVLLGNYNGTPSDPVTLLQGIKDEAAGRGIEVCYEPGCNLVGQYTVLHSIPAGVFSYNGKTGLRAEYFSNSDLEGAASVDRMESEINYNWWQREAFPKLGGNEFSIRWTGTLTPEKTGNYTLSLFGNRGTRLYINGQKVMENWSERMPERIQTRLRLKAGKSYAFQLEYDKGAFFPFIHLEWAIADEKAHARAVKLARKCDLVLFIGGISPELEGEEMDVPYDGFEGGDRTRIDLPDVQQNLLEDIYTTGTPMVLVLNSGSALGVPWANAHIPAILQVWYPGQAGGTAVADVLFGNYNPAGRLPVTCYESTDQLPPFSDYSMTGHTYRYFQGEPLYSFGFGMSYTRFSYTQFEISDTVRAGDPICIRVQVQNTGEIRGEEVVQLYIKDAEARVPVPIWSLQGFERLALEPDESRSISFTLTPKQISLISDALERIVEPGEFIIAVGGGLPGHSAETTEVLIKSVIVKGDPYIVEKLYWEN